VVEKKLGRTGGADPKREKRRREGNLLEDETGDDHNSASQIEREGEFCSALENGRGTGGAAAGEMAGTGKPTKMRLSGSDEEGPSSNDGGDDN